MYLAYSSGRRYELDEIPCLAHDQSYVPLYSLRKAALSVRYCDLAASVRYYSPVEINLAKQRVCLYVQRWISMLEADNAYADWALTFR